MKMSLFQAFTLLVLVISTVALCTQFYIANHPYSKFVVNGIEPNEQGINQHDSFDEGYFAGFNVEDDENESFNTNFDKRELRTREELETLSKTRLADYLGLDPYHELEPDNLGIFLKELTEKNGGNVIDLSDKQRETSDETSDSLNRDKGILATPIISIQKQGSAASNSNSRPNENSCWRSLKLSRECVAIIVPYRRQPTLLRNFLGRAKNLFESLPCWKIFIAEQDDSYAFNRGMLINAALYEMVFGLVNKGNCGVSYSHIIIQDLDVLPIDSDSMNLKDMGYWRVSKRMSKDIELSGIESYLSKIKPSSRIVHLSPSFMNPKYKNPSYFGGNWLINVQAFVDINGFSNLLWGENKVETNFAYRIYNSRHFPYGYPWPALAHDEFEKFFAQLGVRRSLESVESADGEENFTPIGVEKVTVRVKKEAHLFDASSGLDSIVNNYKVVSIGDEASNSRIRRLKFNLKCDPDLTPSCKYMFNPLQPDMFGQPCLLQDCLIRNRIFYEVAYRQRYLSSFQPSSLIRCPIANNMKKIKLLMIVGIPSQVARQVGFIEELYKNTFLELSHCNDVMFDFKFIDSKQPLDFFERIKGSVDSVPSGSSSTSSSSYDYYAFGSGYFWVDIAWIFEFLVSKEQSFRKNPYIHFGCDKYDGEFLIMSHGLTAAVAKEIEKDNQDSETPDDTLTASTEQDSLIDTIQATLKRLKINQELNILHECVLQPQVSFSFNSSYSFNSECSASKRVIFFDNFKIPPSSRSILQKDVFSTLSTRSRLVSAFKSYQSDFPSVNMTKIFCSAVRPDKNWSAFMQDAILSKFFSSKNSESQYHLSYRRISLNTVLSTLEKLNGKQPSKDALIEAKIINKKFENSQGDPFMPSDIDLLNQLYNVQNEIKFKPSI